ncbi:MAG: radical SAM protein [Nanoarchaeota archaeon]|nr:radical SAM protein [Nanoarchaeota archaeon]
MKLYVIPVATCCNASCKYCITKSRKTCGKEFLEISDLKDKLKIVNPNEIEITGGGEPFLHPKINEIIAECSKVAKTQIYTNASKLDLLDPNLNLNFVCISRAHYSDESNKEIMGVDCLAENIKKIPYSLKFSLLLHKSGISNVKDFEEYLNWAKNLGAKKVVVRQLFDGLPEEEYISTEEFFHKLDLQDFELNNENPVFFLKGLEVEFEFRSCSCENKNPILHPDGKIKLEWYCDDIDRE